MPRSSTNIFFCIVSASILILSAEPSLFSNAIASEDFRQGSFSDECDFLTKQHGNGLSCVRVVVTGFENSSGVVRLSLYDREENYNLRKQSCRHAVIPVKEDEKGNVFAEKVFCNLKPGWYAILLFHDSDSDRDFDMFLGMPLERFGFSQNARPGITGAPSFKEARFWLDPGRCRSIEIRLQSLLGS